MAAINNLPENFEVEGDVTNLYIGDFNGDGLDDFLRQEKGRRDNDNNNTANIFFSNSDGTFTKFDLPENFEVEGDLTNISVGDFNGDGLDDFLRQEKGRRDNDNNNKERLMGLILLLTTTRVSP
ncbi:MAG: VCBS repeat-containing protein [Okeania sp. SIO2C9]|uniref:FG-GAP repeat domain-containing protein n=1 Tax=Okeania sp. SIO2C9 TaxID=2607791 RepID=UPI0013C0846D|nr:VCBS repeat-containing protein [Okeania sp. SIO2C9]NEQ72405.1 VCBS repeat-containing protein [Okeania sp. SIO2C9]